jgi:hypothetical protein
MGGLWMNEDAFRTLLTEHLLPMLAGADLGKTTPSSASHELVAYGNPVVLLMKPTHDAHYRIQLVRSQAFTSEEKQLVSLFVEEVAEIPDKADPVRLLDLMSAVPRRVIGRFLPGNAAGRGTLEQAIRDFESLSSQTYEGHAVVAALGITGSVAHGPIKLGELWREDFSRVISNGFDSMYLCGSDGRVFNVLYLPNPPSVHFAPHRLGSIAEWCRNQRVAVVLNRSGEVLVFKDRKLQFAKRRGAWRYYAHDSVVMRLGVGNTSLRRAVYESCLDVSFARTGGCVAVMNEAGRSKIGKFIDSNDLIEQKKRTRTKLLDRAVRNSFQKLDRRLRQELLSMDGATVLTRKGEVLTAGSIVRVPSGSAGGGRRAAAIQLSRLGLAIKISADGPITGFRKKKTIFSL